MGSCYSGDHNAREHKTTTAVQNRNFRMSVLLINSVTLKCALLWKTGLACDKV